MPSYQIETPDGAVYEIDAADDKQLQSTIAQLIGNDVLSPRSRQEASKRYSATEGMSGFEKFRAGAGKAFTDIGRGVSQLNKKYEARFLPQDVRDLIEAEGRGRMDEVQRMDAPLLKGAGRAGNITGNIAAAAPTAFIPGANTYTGAATLGSILGALQPVGSDDSRLVNASLGAAGGAAGKGIGDVLTKIGRSAIGSMTRSGADVNIGPSVSGAQANVTGNLNVSMKGSGPSFGTVGPDPAAGLNAAQQQAAAGGRALGMRMTPGQATGSRSLLQLEAKMESQPWSSGPFNAIKSANQTALNRATAKAIGETADTVDSTVLARANERLGAVFDDVRDDVARAIEPQTFTTKLQAINDEFEGLLPGGANVTQHPLVQRLMRYAEGGEASGKQLGGLTSKLGRAAYKEMTGPSGDREMGQALYAVKDYVDDLVEQGLSGARLSAYQAARGQYRNLVNITSRIGVVNPSSGNVNGATLANTLQKSDKSGFLFGNNKTDMYAAARFAQAFKPIVGDSGTATRSPFQSIPDFVVGLPINLATRAYASSPGVRAAVASQAAARGTQEAISPLLLGAAPYLPAVGGILGPQAAR